MKRAATPVLCLAAYIPTAAMVKPTAWINGKLDNCHCISIASKKVESEHCLLTDTAREHNIPLLPLCHGL